MEGNLFVLLLNETPHEVQMYEEYSVSDRNRIKEDRQSGR